MIIYLNSPWFELVKEGKKIYEGRRHTKIIENIKINDILEVRHYVKKELESFNIIVLDKLYYKTFEHALQCLNINEVLPIENITLEQGIDIYKQFVSLATQEKDGVCMLKIKLV
jgi:hypothetical protein